MSILGALLFYGAAKMVSEEVTIRNYKQYDKKEREIENKYRCSGAAIANCGVTITACNPRYVEYIKEINEFRAGYGQPPIMSIEKAKSERERYLEIFKNSVDKNGYVIDKFGWKMN